MPWSRNRPRSAEYGSDWQKTREQWAARHHPSDPCYRCRHPLGPMSRHLHLDHDDIDRSIIRGFSHGDEPCPYCGVRCNLSAGARAARARQNTTKLRW